jgi:hypothetical protein
VLSSKQRLMLANPCRDGVSVFRAFLVLVLAVLLTSCGGGVGNIRVLQAITVTPENVTAPASGTVKFTAKGTFNKPPTTITPLQVVWTVGRSDFSQAPVPAVATIDANGVAKCLPGASASIDIFASSAKDPSQPYGINNFTSGSTKLTCP